MGEQAFLWHNPGNVLDHLSFMSAVEPALFMPGLLPYLLKFSVTVTQLVR
jgi:hypothetical protein